jgi:drug/metabolite transporter (DMT)-like permease
MEQSIAGRARRRWDFDRIAPPAAAAGAFICVGISVVATRFAVKDCDTLTLAFMRNGLAFVLLFPFLRRATAQAAPINARDLLWICLLGLSSFAAFPLLFTAALRYAPATHGALALPAATPPLTLFLATVLGRERWTVMKFAGVALAALGVAAVLSDSDWSGAASSSSEGLIWLGDLMMILAAATIAIYNVLTKPYLVRYGTLKLLSVALGVGAGALLLLVSLRALREGVAWPRFDLIEWSAILAVGLASALSNWLWSWALSRTTPTRVAVFIALNPVVAVFAAIVLLGETLSPTLLVGLFVVIAGIVLVNRPETDSDTK